MVVTFFTFRAKNYNKWPTVYIKDFMKGYSYHTHSQTSDSPTAADWTSLKTHSTNANETIC